MCNLLILSKPCCMRLSHNEKNRGVSRRPPIGTPWCRVTVVCRTAIRTIAVNSLLHSNICATAVVKQHNNSNMIIIIIWSILFFLRGACRACQYCQRKHCWVRGFGCMIVLLYLIYKRIILDNKNNI